MHVLATLSLAAVATVPPGLRGKDVESLPTRARVVALTFDAGSDSGHSRSILRTLRREQVPATFFVTGRFAHRYPLLTRVIAHAHPVGNHTETHRPLTRLSDVDVRREILRGESSLRSVTRSRPTRLFRFPEGDRDARTIGLANALGYVCVRWTVDTHGWMTASPSSVVRRVLDGLRPGAIVLMHVGVESADASALPAVIAAVRRRGYRFVTLESLEPR